jgi:serine/threonine protein kinase
MPDAHDALREGALINNQFRLKRQIGVGGAGSVWEADHLRLHTSVALKFLGHHYLRDKETLARFEREAHTASRLRSPHVVQVLDQGTTEGGIPYLAMELLEGEDLAALLDRQGRCSLVETALILHQVGRALSKAHKHGLVHRDIKPHNIFLTPLGDNELFVKLLDFGIAKDISQDVKAITLTGTLLGSVRYISPEQLDDSQSVGLATDIWALGIVVYEMLTGLVPFDGRSVADVLKRVNEGTYQALTTLRPDLPAELDDWLCMAIQPVQALRFPSVEEMSRAFTRIARSHSPTLFESWADEPFTSPAVPMALVASHASRDGLVSDSLPYKSFARSRQRRRTIIGLSLCACTAIAIGLLATVMRQPARRDVALVPAGPAGVSQSAHVVTPKAMPNATHTASVPALPEAEEALAVFHATPTQRLEQAPPKQQALRSSQATARRQAPARANAAASSESQQVAGRKYRGF